MCACRVGKVVCACGVGKVVCACGAGEGCNGIVWDGVVLICRLCREAGFIVHLHIWAVVSQDVVQA